MDQLLQALAVVVVVLAIAMVAGRFIRFVTVHEFERGLHFRNGRLTGLTGPGTHLSVRPFSEIHTLDGRPTTLFVEGQEVMTADGVPVKVSLVARYVVGDPVAATVGDQSYQSAIYVMLQLALREAIAGRTLDDTLPARREIGPAVRQACASELANLGIELLAVEVRDLMVPGELKRAFASVIAARKDSEAALERARGETAALRALANAGRMLEDNPGLLQLRAIQQVGGSSGNTLMLGLPDSGGAGGGNSGAAAAPTAPAASAVVRRARRPSASGVSDAGLDGA